MCLVCVMEACFCMWVFVNVCVSVCLKLDIHLCDEEKVGIFQSMVFSCIPASLKKAFEEINRIIQASVFC